MQSERASEQQAIVLDTARALVQQEFAITERLDAKARNQATVAGAWFALVQVVAGGALQIDGLDQAWIAAIGAAFAVAAIAMATLFGLSLKVWGIRDEEDVRTDQLHHMLRDAGDPDVDVVSKLTMQAQATLRGRRASNSDRAKYLRRAQIAWLAAMAMALVQLSVSFAARIFG